MSKPVRPFLGESAEDRVRSRRNLLIEKGFELIADKAWRQASIAQICRDVKLNKRYFYESFESLEELENTVINELTSELIAVALKTVSQPQANALVTEQLARDVLKACVSWLAEDPRKASVLFSYATDNDRARAQREGVINQLAQTLANFGFNYHQPANQRIEITHTHKTVAKLSSALMIGGTIESILIWLDGKLDLSIDELVEYLAKFWVSLGDTAVSIAQPSDD